MSQGIEQVQWEQSTVSSPHLTQPVPVIAALDVPYIKNANRLQNLRIYLPVNANTSALIGTPVTSIPRADPTSGIPTTLVHIHGGAWRDSKLTASSVEPVVAHAFNPSSSDLAISCVIALNYTVSPTQHPKFHPYDPVKDNHSDPAREAVHPQHVRDVLSGFSLLRSLGLTDKSYILSGHSAGACLCFQAIFQPPSHYDFDDLLSPPCPAALVGLNGLYDLEQLVHGLGPSHKQLKDDYNTFLSVAFGDDQLRWSLASPARFDADDIAKRVKEGQAPRLVLLDQSSEDQLVPMNQRERLITQLEQVQGMKVVRGHRSSGEHAAPWKEGYMLWNNVLDVLESLREEAG